VRIRFANCLAKPCNKIHFDYVNIAVKLIDQIKGSLETPEKGAATVTMRLVDYAVITWAVPVERVTPLLPEGLTPDRLPGPEGELLAFVQTTCAFCEDARWSPTPIGSGESYHTISYRILARREKTKPGAFVLRAFYNTDSIHIAGRAVHKEADFTRLSVTVSGNPVRGTYTGYRLRAVADRGTTEWEIGKQDAEETALAPFGDREDMARFLLRREAIYFQPSAAPKGNVLYAPIAFPTELPEPRSAHLVSARLTPWRDMGVLSTEEVLAPQSVLLLPALTVTTYPPRLVKTVSPPVTSA